MSMNYEASQNMIDAIENNDEELYNIASTFDTKFAFFGQEIEYYLDNIIDCEIGGWTEMAEDSYIISRNETSIRQALNDQLDEMIEDEVENQMSEHYDAFANENGPEFRTQIVKALAALEVKKIKPVKTDDFGQVIESEIEYLETEFKYDRIQKMVIDLKVAIQVFESLAEKQVATKRDELATEIRNELEAM
jgi:hypothetical protein